jgi:hypothetical protein
VGSILDQTAPTVIDLNAPASARRVPPARAGRRHHGGGFFRPAERASSRQDHRTAHRGRHLGQLSLIGQPAGEETRQCEVFGQVVAQGPARLPVPPVPSESPAGRSR